MSIQYLRRICVVTYYFAILFIENGTNVFSIGFRSSDNLILLHLCFLCGLKNLSASDPPWVHGRFAIGCLFTRMPRRFFSFMESGYSFFLLFYSI